MKINIKKLSPTAEIPTRESASAAGYDLKCYLVDVDGIKFQTPRSSANRFASDGETVNIYPGETAKIHTGIAVEIPEGYFGGIYARSGFATKQGMRPANCVGVIDSDYRGEIVVAIHNDGDTAVSIKRGDRVAQLVIMPYLSVEFNEVDRLTTTDRGEDGFGSTGKN